MAEQDGHENEAHSRTFGVQWQYAAETRSDGVPLEQAPSDHELLDLIGAFAQDQDRSVSVDTLDPVLL
jgi:hypothetical protein